MPVPLESQQRSDRQDACPTFSLTNLAASAIVARHALDHSQTRQGTSSPAGHCWVYAGEIAKITGEPRDGDAVDFATRRTAFRDAACSTPVPRSQSAASLPAKLDEPFFRQRIEAALRYRGEISGDAFRIISSEADLLPGLILDKYGDQLVLQALTLGIDQRKTVIMSIVRELLQPRAIIERSDVPTRKLEGQNCLDYKLVDR